MEKSWKMTNWPKVMECCDQSWNFTNFDPKFYQICMFFVTANKLSSILESISNVFRKMSPESYKDKKEIYDRGPT